MDNKHTVLITGCSGYVGAMLVEKFLERADIEHIIGIDKEDVPDFLEGKEHFTFLKTNLSNTLWRDKVREHKPSIVIHTAWQIREMYGQKDKQWEWNVDGTDAVFDFVFNNDFVKKLVHFSTVSIYGAEATNELEQRFVETDPLRERDYLYGVEKRVSEEHLQEKLTKARNKPEVFVVRPAAITGPRGRFMRTRFGLQSALSGQLKDSPSFVHRLVSAMVAIVPITKKWCRQFIHEDDVVDIIEMLAFEKSGDFEIFNICPSGDIVRGPDMARAVGKKAIMLPPWIIRIVYFFAWHLSGGKIPTSKGGWKFYSYPVAVDGSKITKQYGYEYKYESHDAFTKVKGRYASRIEK